MNSIPYPKSEGYKKESIKWSCNASTKVLSRIGELSSHIEKATDNGYFWSLSRGKQRAVIDMIASLTDTPKKVVRQQLLESKKPADKPQAI